MNKRVANSLLAVCLIFLASCSTLNPFNPGRDNFEAGLTLFNQGRFAESIPYFEDATHQNPDFAEAYLYLGRAHISQSQWRAAIPPLRTAFRLSPRSAQQEISSLLVDALFAAALNGFRLGDNPTAPLRPRNTL